MDRRKFYPGVLNHCYQRTADHGVLFYSVSDHLMFFTVFCLMVVRHQVRVFKLVQMPDHIHSSVIAGSLKQLSAFVRDYTSTFAREYNRCFGISGPVFETPFGSASKRRSKDVKTNLIYLDNNPVERKLVSRAEDYRWNYLAYAASEHPYSEKIVLREASMPLRRALEKVRLLHAGKRYLTYPLLQKLFASLPDRKEKEQLIDYIICTYSVIDHEAATSYFGGYEQELIASHATSGSEYDLQETFVGKSDECYAKFTSLLLREGYVSDIHDILSMSASEKKHLFNVLQRRIPALLRQIAAFLHLPVELKR